MVHWSLRVRVAAQMFVARQLIPIEQGAGFEMRRQMHGAQTTLQFGNRRRRSGEAILRDVALSKELIEGLFLRDQFAAKRPCSGSYAVEDRLYIAVLGVGQ